MYNNSAKKQFVMIESKKRDLETVLAFDQFKAKTSSNIAAWLTAGHARGGIRADYILCHATEGASNAVGAN
jgi:hypothetical protein